VNQRLREFLETSQVLPEDIADRYSLGVFEASLVLQAVDYGDTAEAKKHLILAVKNFRQVIDSVAKERMIFEHAVALEASSDETSEAALERYVRIKEFYFRLEEVAEKNGVDNESEFGTIIALLAKSKQMIDEGDLEEANHGLAEANDMLESIRISLYGDEASKSSENSTLSATDPQARKLSSVADKFEKSARSILEKNQSEHVNATVQRVLSLVVQARLDIENSDYDAARSNLSDAFFALDEARELVEQTQQSGRSGDDSAEGDEKKDDGQSSSGSDDNEQSSGPDKGEDDRQ
jgi:hypothetical protein